ncbi:MAG: dienelactone hydrolase family protein [Deltaproteobacteria bacterium]|nr:dienelactone hydrolase family protein [Deltaproteobacteria bacterium]
MTDPALSRRELLRAGAIAAGYTLAAGPVQAGAVSTASEGLVHGPVGIPASGGSVPAYRARPASGGPHPLVLVVHEIFGVHEYIQDICRRLAHAGYTAVAPDLYQRHGDVRKLTDVRQIIDGVVAKVPDAEVMSDLDATVKWAGESGEADASRVGITGFCWGGRVVWLYAAHSARLDAGVAWYGRLVGDARPQTPKHPLELAGSLRAPVLGLYGGLDRGIPVATVEEMRAAVAKHGKPCELVVYDDAHHGFHADYRPSYNAEAAADGWRRLLDWLRKNGV